MIFPALLLSLLLPPAHADNPETAARLAEECQRGIEKLAEAGKAKSCNRHQTPDPYPTTTFKASNGEDIEISVVPKEKLKDLHYYVTTLGTPLRHRRLCAQRAHIMSYSLYERYGIKSGKLMTKPGRAWVIYPGTIQVDYPDGRRYHLDYHVASFVAVEENGKMEQYVIDPFTFTEPVKREVWEKRQQNRAETFITDRFALDLRDVKEKNIPPYQGRRSIAHTWQVIEQERGKP